MRSKVVSLAVALYLIPNFFTVVPQTTNTATISAATLAAQSTETLRDNGLVNPAAKQRIASTNESLPSGPTRDSSAIAVLRQVLLVSGGLQVQKLPAFAGAGTITYFNAKGHVEAPMVVKGRGLYDFSLVAKLPEGERRLVLNRNAGEYVETDGKRRPIVFLSAINSAIPVIPQLWFSVALADEQVSILDKGETSLNDHQVRVIRIQPKLFANNDGVMDSLVKKDFYVDVQSLRILQIIDEWHSGESALQSTQQVVEFPEYSSMVGILTPIRIVLKMHGNVVAELRISELSFNPQFDGSSFQLGN